MYDDTLSKKLLPWLQQVSPRLPTSLLVCPLMVLVCPLLVLVCPLLVLVCSLLLLVCSLLQVAGDGATVILGDPGRWVMSEISAEEKDATFEFIENYTLPPVLDIGRTYRGSYVVLEKH